jgi:hypothetical protein
MKSPELETPANQIVLYYNTQKLPMRRLLFSTYLLLYVFTIVAQKREEGFDHSFKPTPKVARYYVVTEKKDSLWHREAWYLPEKGMAMQGWYKDKECKIESGEVTWYHSNKNLKSKGLYINGKKEGSWLEYDEEGRLEDSSYYTGGRLKGVSLHWYPDGMIADSTQFDGEGNGVQVSWHEDGSLAAAGLWVSDTSRKGRWKYYHPNEQLMATEDYVNGKIVSCNCFDETGRQLDSADCKEKESEFPGGSTAWQRFINKNLRMPQQYIDSAKGNAACTIVYEFVIGTDGSVQQLKPLTHFGYGLEEEVERMIKLSPLWIPARQHGQIVKSYKKQPITFHLGMAD